MESKALIIVSFSFHISKECIITAWSSVSNIFLNDKNNLMISNIHRRKQHNFFGKFQKLYMLELVSPTNTFFHGVGEAFNSFMALLDSVTLLSVVTKM